MSHLVGGPPTTAHLTFVADNAAQCLIISSFIHFNYNWFCLLDRTLMEPPYPVPPLNHPPIIFVLENPGRRGRRCRSGDVVQPDIHLNWLD